jgi:hypothetical protein
MTFQPITSYVVKLGAPARLARAGTLGGDPGMHREGAAPGEGAGRVHLNDGLARRRRIGGDAQRRVACRAPVAVERREPGEKGDQRAGEQDKHNGGQRVPGFQDQFHQGAILSDQDDTRNQTPRDPNRLLARLKPVWPRVRLDLDQRRRTKIGVAFHRAHRPARITPE